MKKKAAVWVSTVLYILISLAILGIILAAVQPRINAARDKAIIDQSLNMLNNLDQKIIEVDNAAVGNVRSLSLQIKSGVLVVNGTGDKIEWFFEDSAYKYSEPNEEVKIGRINVLTVEGKDGFDIKLSLDYSGELDVASALTLQPAEVPYNIFIKNNGTNGGQLNRIEIYFT